jgi:asparagine synthase (glutamine-hydrolysing)
LPALAARANVTSNPRMSLYHGSIDFSSLPDVPPANLFIESRRDLRRVSLPWLELQWTADSASVALDGGVLALASGRTRSRSADSSDAENWIARYARHGANAADDVDGEFSVVIIDFDKRQLLLVVDRFAIRTLCYRFDSGLLGFSDDACDVPHSSKAVNAQSLYDYFYFHVIPAPETVFADVQRVEAAHRVIVSAAKVDSSCYWQPVFVENDRHDLPGRLREFVAIVKNCVEHEADGAATACFLSGGTDSSTIAGMLTRLRGEPVHAYSIGFDAGGYDEMEYARIAARHFGLVHHEYYLTPDDLVDAIPRMAASFDQPFGNSSVLPAYFCALRAKEDGFARMLAGDGGDELFGGNSRYAMQKLFELYGRLPATLRTQVLEPAATNWALFKRVPGFKQMGGYVRHSRVPMPDRLDNFKLLNRLGDSTIFDADFHARIDAERPLAQQRMTWNAGKADSLLNRMLAYDWKYTLAENDLPKVRYATQLAGTSVGYPFLSRSLTEFSLSLPPDWKLKGLKLRWFFKEALRDFLPQEILRKKKHGFGLPFGHWILRHEGLRGLAEDALKRIVQRGVVMPQFTTELLTRRLPEAPGYYGEMVWLLMMLEQWLQAHQTTSRTFDRVEIWQECVG